MQNIFDILGWLGLGLLVIAYILLNTKHLAQDSVSYLWLNFFGSFAIMLNSFYNGAYPPAVLNAIWMIFTTYFLLRKIGSNLQI